MLEMDAFHVIRMAIDLLINIHSTTTQCNCCRSFLALSTHHDIVRLQGRADKMRVAPSCSHDPGCLQSTSSILAHELPSSGVRVIVLGMSWIFMTWACKI